MTAVEAGVALVNLGCRVNRVELDSMALELQRRGYRLTGQHEAQVIVINTCAVTGEAQAKTRKAVRRAAKMPQRPIVVATGCVASLFADELRSLGENVVVEPLKSVVADRVTEALSSGLAGEGAASAGAAITVDHPTPTGRTRPGIKIQDGCDNRCTFCIVWKARGRSHSIDTGKVLDEVRAAQQRGAQEVVLTGINLGNFRGKGRDGSDIALPGLLEEVLDQTDVRRIRLSSIEPPDVTDELLDVMSAAGERVAPFLHVCLQSGCDKTLREMGRVYDTAFFADMVARTRRAIPQIALGTDLIVGFPGETENDFDQTMAFCGEMHFARMHVFRYSKRPGTPAAAREDQVDAHKIAERSERMLALAQQKRLECARERVGQEELVVVQYPGRGVSGGLFDVLVDDAFDVDDLVRVRVHEVLADGTLDARSQLAV